MASNQLINGHWIVPIGSFLLDLDRAYWISQPVYCPKTGFNRAQNTANESGDFICFFDVSFRVFVGFTYSSMANLGFRTYCNIFQDIFGTSNTSTKSGPLDPLSITDFSKHPRTNSDHFQNNVIWHISTCRKSQKHLFGKYGTSEFRILFSFS